MDETSETFGIDDFKDFDDFKDPSTDAGGEFLDDEFELTEQKYWKNWDLNHSNNPNRKEFMEKKIRQKRRQVIKLRENFFNEKLDQSVVMKDGPSSKLLIHKSDPTFDREGNVKGLMFKKEKIMGVNAIGELKFMLSRGPIVKEFKELMEKAKEEHLPTLYGKIEKEVGGVVSGSDAKKIKDNIYYTWNTDLDIKLNVEQGTKLTKQEYKEFEGVKKAKNHTRNIPFLITNGNYFFEKAENEKDPGRKKELENIAKMSLEKAELIRLKGNNVEEDLLAKRVVNEDIFYDAKEELEVKIANDTLTKFEKFKKFARKNLGTIGGIVISIAGVIVTIVMYVSTGVVTAAQAAAATAQAIAKLAKNAVPTLLPLINVLITALSWGAQGLAWLSDNMWLLAIGFSYILRKNGILL